MICEAPKIWCEVGRREEGPTAFDLGGVSVGGEWGLGFR
jgi:hypothetical protein